MKVPSLKNGRVIERDLDKLIDRHFNLSDTTSWYICALGKELQKLEAKNKELKEILIEYGAHLKGCNAEYNLTRKCTCGFNRAMEI